MGPRVEPEQAHCVDTPWYADMLKTMDQKLEKLRAFPSRFPQEITSESYAYPLQWDELLGVIFHKYNYQFHRFISQDLPMPQLTDYR